MNPAHKHFQNTGTILAALQSQVENLPFLFADGTWTADGDEPVNEAAFGDVRIFDADDLIEAFRWLVTVAQRVCVIVPGTVRWELDSGPVKMIVRRVMPVSLLISDRVLGDRTASLLGNAQTPGAMGLKDVVLPAVTGQLIANPSGVVSRPTSEYVVNLKKKDLPNRVCLCLELECRGGRMDAAVSPVL